MKNLFRIYLNELRSLLYLFVLLLVLIRIAVFVLHATLENGTTAFFERVEWNVHCPFLIAMMVMQTFFLIYRRKELTLLPETNKIKCNSMILYIGLHYVAMYGVLIGVDLLLNAIFAIFQPSMLYSPFVSVLSLANFIIQAPVDCMFLLLLIVLFNFLLPLLINKLLLFFPCSFILMLWIFLSWMETAAYMKLERGIFADEPWLALLFVAGIVACRYLGQYCFNRRAVCDHKLLNL